MNILLNLFVWGSLLGIVKYGHYMKKKFEQQYGYWNWKEFHRLNGLKLLGLLFVWVVVIVLLYQIFPDFALWHREG